MLNTDRTTDKGWLQQSSTAEALGTHQKRLYTRFLYPIGYIHHVQIINTEQHPKLRHKRPQPRQRGRFNSKRGRDKILADRGAAVARVPRPQKSSFRVHPTSSRLGLYHYTMSGRPRKRSRCSIVPLAFHSNVVGKHDFSLRRFWLPQSWRRTPFLMVRRRCLR